MKKKLAALGIALVILFTALGMISCASVTTPTSSFSPTTNPAEVKKVNLRFAYFASDFNEVIESNIATFNMAARDAKIELCPSASLVNVPESLDAVKTGVAEMATYPMGPFVNSYQNFGFTETPFLYDSVEANNYGMRLLQSDFSEQMEKEFNQKLLGAYTVGPLALNSVKPVKTLEDWKGLLVGSISPSVVSLVTALGGTTVNINDTDTYAALQKGLIDAVLMTPTAVLQNNQYKVAPYVVDGFFIPTSFAITINLDAYNSLSKDTQDFLVQVNNELLVDLDKYMQETNYGPGPNAWEKRLEALVGADNITLLSKTEREEMKALVQSINEEQFAAAGDFGRKVKQYAAEANTKYPYPY